MVWVFCYNLWELWFFLVSLVYEIEFLESERIFVLLLDGSGIWMIGMVVRLD